MGVIMCIRPVVHDRVIAFARRVYRATLALPLLILFAEQAAIAQTDSKARADARAELEQRVLEIVHMFQNDPRYNRRPPHQIKDGVEFVTGNVLFVLGHETGHALISEMAIPVLGREEDAVDALATIVAVKMTNSFADRVVVNAARGWFLSDQRDRKQGIPTTYYDQHGMDLQRAYAIVCLLVGGQPDKFTDLANEVKIPEERQGTCRDDFYNASWSWEQALKPHRRKPEDPRTKIEVNYGPPAEDFAALAALGRRLQILEAVATWLSEDFVWKTPISIEMQQCGDPGARWEWKTKKIVVCYEMIREFSQLHRTYGQMELVPGTMRMSKNQKVVVEERAGKRLRQKAVRSKRAAR
jgi:Putative metallopeptidase